MCAKPKTMMIDGMPVLIENEKNILEVIRKAGIDLPTFCYHSELSTYGACRMCVVENKWGDIEASCSSVPRDGMEIYTNTPKVRKYRKMILELLLSSHCRDCTTCNQNGTCKLQELARRYGVNTVRFQNSKTVPEIDDSSASITRDISKCILCGDCVRVCDEVMNVGAIDFVGRGSKMKITPAFGDPINTTSCVGCGQCAAVCPTGAITIKNDVSAVWDAIYDPDCKVVVQVAPAVRVGIGQMFGMKPGEDVMGKVVAALKRLGFNKVFDTVTGADLTVLEEANEFLTRLENPEKLPLFTSCCPAWVKYAEEKHPELLSHLSTCRSPMQMFGAVLKEQYKNEGKKIISDAIMPCTAKKSEAKRVEFNDEQGPATDFVLTTQELGQMIKEAGIVFNELDPQVIDQPFGIGSGAGVIFGVTGGVTEAVIRRVSEDKSNVALQVLEYKGVRGFDGIKETEIEVGETVIKIAIVSGLANAERLIKEMQEGKRFYHFVEVMACPGGCVSGAGQPVGTLAMKKKRGEGLYQADKMSILKHSEANPTLAGLYSGVLKGKVHELLHRTYVDKRIK